MTTKAVVFTWDGGDLDPRDIPDLSDRYVIAADSGLATALAAGAHVDLVIGDMDSVAGAQLADAEASGAHVERHPAEKDKTDLELALDRATQIGCSEILVLGGTGGRLDHGLATLVVLASDAYAGVIVSALLGRTRIAVIRGASVELQGGKGGLVSLFALGRDARAIRTEGLLYALDGGTIEANSSLGVSNVFTEPIAKVSVGDGVLVAVQPAQP